MITNDLVPPSGLKSFVIMEIQSSSAGHNMPHVFELADRIHIQRLGRCTGVITPASHTMEEAVAIMTGATTLDGAPDGNGTADPA